MVTPAHRWTYRPASGLVARPKGFDGRPVAVRTALRAAHAAGVAFRLCVTSGPEGALQLITDDAASTRWASRLLLPAYGGAEWARTWPPPVSRLPYPQWEMLRHRAWPIALRSLADGASLSESLSGALQTVPRGACIELGISSSPGRFLTAVRVPSAGPGAPRRHGPAADADRDSPRPRAPEIEHAPRWRLRALLYEDGRTRKGTARDPALRRAAEAATRSDNGNGLWARPIRSWSSLRDLGFATGEAELLHLLPGVWGSSTAGAPVLRDSAGPVLPLGRDPAGRVVGPPVERDQGRHLAILGETGMGKSSLLVAVARRAARRSGLVLLDPIGETAEAVRRELALGLGDRLLWIDALKGPGLNALRGAHEARSGDPARADRELNDLVHALRRVRSSRYPETSFWGPRLEEMLLRALRVAAAVPGGTLVDAHRLLASGGRGFRTLPPAAVEPANELADRIRARPEDADGALRLLHEVVGNSVLRRMICDPDGSTAASEWVTRGRAVLVSGGAAAVGEVTSRYLLSVYLALLWSELLARSDRAKTFVLLDEAQWYGHESLAEMLRLGRHDNVHVVLATQALSSLPAPVVEAVRTNVADWVSFRGSSEEARELVRFRDGMPVDAILSLPRGEAAVFLGKGEATGRIRTVRVPSARPWFEGPGGVPRSTPVPPEIPTAPTSFPANRPDGPSSPGPTPEDVIEELRRRASEEGPNTPFPVSLASLRETVDPSGIGVRAAGSLLHRTGAIVRVERTDRGTRWWIAPGRLPGPSDESGPELRRPAEDEGKS